MPRPKPDLNDPEYVGYAILLNSLQIALAEHNLMGTAAGQRFITLTEREAIATRLWDWGYRKVSDPDETVE